ncbi:MAG TPA: hypothetical protein VGM88_19955 [Kofleriaceae bacterium]|jgi:hypothetical protein
MKAYARTFGVALAVVVALMVATHQVGLAKWWAPHGAYRAQTQALLEGHFALTDRPQALRHDLAWAGGGVQHVWGLGVPLWQLPFEAVAELGGFAPFPDRVPMILWLTLAAFLVLRAVQDPWERAGACLLTIGLPAFVALLRGRVNVYEEAAAYAYTAGIALLAGLLILRRRPTAQRYLLLVGFAGLGGLVRPTVWFYGLGTLAIATALLVRAIGWRRALAPIAIGGALFVAGGGALYATNALRFGSGTEFGHRLNLELIPGNLYATRFDNLYARAGWLEGAEELGGALFDQPETRAELDGFYQTHLAAGESPRQRFREYYFTVFTWWYVPLLAGGALLAGLAWRRRGDPVARVTGAWAALGLAPLAIFYIHAPSLTSRYLLDLAPAFAALLLLVWRWAVAKHAQLAAAALALLWVAAILSSTVLRRPSVARRADAIAQTEALAAPDPTAYHIPDGWTLASHPPLTLSGLFLDGMDWDPETGSVPAATFFYTQDPQFVEIIVAGPPDTDWQHDIRANLDGEHLALTSATRAGDGAMWLHFAASAPHHGLALAFVAFGHAPDLATDAGPFRLLAIRWR